MKFWKIILTGLLLLYCFYYAGAGPDSWHFIDAVDLVIHEAGHVIFWPFGEFMHILGGSLNQVLLPLIFAGYFYWRKELYSAGLVLYWVAINFINVSIYAGDAVKLQLPLLTGDKDTHDWNQLLFRLGWLHHTALVSSIIFYAGIASMFAAFALSFYAAYSETKTSDPAV